MAKAKNKPFALPKGTLVYPKIRQPDTGHKYSTGKYQTFIAYEDQSVIDDLEQACSELIEEAWGDNVDPAEVRRPYTLPEDQEKEIFEGMATVKASSKYKPQVVDAKKRPVPKSVFPGGGDVCVVAITLSVYETTENVKQGKKVVKETAYGISARLNVVQIIEKNSGGNLTNMLEEHDDGFDSDGMPDEDPYVDDETPRSNDAGDGEDDGDDDGDF